MRATVFALTASLVTGATSLAYAQTGSVQQPGAGADDQALPKGFQVTPLIKSSMTADEMKVVYPRTDTPEIVAVIGTLEADGRTPRHQHPVPNFVYVMEGTLDVQSDGMSKRTYSAGQSFIESQNHWHQAFNNQSAPAKLLVVFMGEQGKPTTVTAK